MQALIWIGAATALAGVAALGWCIREAMRLRDAALSPDESRRALRRVQDRVMTLATIHRSLYAEGQVDAVRADRRSQRRWSSAVLGRR